MNEPLAAPLPLLSLPTRSVGPVPFRVARFDDAVAAVGSSGSGPVVDLREGPGREAAQDALPWWASQAPPDLTVSAPRRRSPRLAARGSRSNASA